MWSGKVQDNTSFEILDAQILDIDGAWILWPQEPDDSLCASISRQGQIAPVVAVRENGCVKVVAGYRRVLAARKLDISVKAVIIDADPVERGLLYIQENSGRIPDDSMKLAAMRFFHPLIDGKRLQSEVAPMLGIKPKSRDMKLWLAWLGLAGKYDRLLSSGSVPLAAANILSFFAESDLEVLAPFFSNLNWSRSNAVNFLTWLYEYSRHSGKSISETVALENLRPRGEDENPKDAVARLTAHARSIRYPHLSGLEADFLRLSTEISSGTGWRISQTGNFEGGDSEITFRIRSRADLEKALASLGDISSSDLWEKLWNLGRDK